MRLTRLAALLALIAGLAAFSAAPSQAQEAPGSPAPSATPANPALPSPKPAPDDPKMHKFAVQQFLAWQNGTVDRNLYSDDVNDQLTDDMMDRATKTLANMGGLQKVTFRGISSTKGANFYVYHMTCERGSVDMDFALDTDGKVALIFFE
jgi:hypothetical protein